LWKEDGYRILVETRACLGQEDVFGVAVSSRFLEDSVTGNNDDSNDGSPKVCNS
jgi:hypothetical protein